MNYLFARLHVLGIRLSALIQDKTHNERGSVTTEVILWALAVITLAGIVVAALNGYITAQVSKLG